MSSRPLHVVAAAILREGRCLVAQRGHEMSQPGRWELPGGQVEPGENPRSALARELDEELGVQPQVGDWLGRSDVIAGGRRILMDLYAVALLHGPVTLRQHSRIRWLDAVELGEPAALGSEEWAAADVPLLAAVAARLRSDPAAHRCSKRPVILSVDWGKKARRRAACIARLGAEGWTLIRPAPPPGGWSLEHLLRLASDLRDEQGAPVLLGIDAALGLPAAHVHAVGPTGFLAALDRLDRSGGLHQEANTAEEWQPLRPFFRVPPGRGSLTKFQLAAGGRSRLLRQIDLRTGAKSVFILSGIPGAVGSGSRALWQELVALPDLGPAARESFSVWPFDGTLATLTERPAVLLAEVYPRASYAVALAESLPARIRPLAKTKSEARAAALVQLEEADWALSHGVRVEDLDPARESEDDFDALMTAAALIRLVAEERPLSHELVDSVTEGGILGTGEMILGGSHAHRRSRRRTRKTDPANR